MAQWGEGVRWDIVETEEGGGPESAAMAKDRMRRVNEAVREVLGVAIGKDLKDPRIGFVTVTAVDTSPDLRHARVYVSVLGDEERRAKTLAGLASSHGYLQGRVAAELRLKHTPQLEFVYDESADRGMRISQLLRDAEPKP
jgi:ribosome-binding factor A